MAITEMSVVANMEVKSLSEFQYPNHIPFDDKEEIESRLSRTPKKCAWTIHCKEELKPMITTQADQIGFSANTEFDRLRKVRIEMNWPAVWIKPEMRDKLRICLTHNALHHVIKSAKCIVGKETPQTLSTITLDTHLNCMFKSNRSKAEQASANIGNVPMLTQWSNDCLPKFKAMMYLPFWFYKHEVASLPLYYGSSTNSNTATPMVVEFHLVLNNLYSQLIRMQMFHNGEWKNVPFDHKFLMGFTSAKAKLPPLKMIGYYSKLSPEEVLFRQETPYQWYIEDWITWTSEDTYPMGISCPPISISSDTPTKAIWWLAQNMEAAKFNNHCNYTTDNENVSVGWHPISYAKLLYGSQVRAEGDHDDFSRGNQDEWPSVPLDNGYQGLVYATDLTSVDADTCVILNALDNNVVRLVLTLSDTCPFADIQDMSQAENTSQVDVNQYMKGLEGSKDKQIKGCFKIHTLQLVQRILKLETGKFAEVIGCKGDKIAKLSSESKEKPSTP